MRRTLTLTLLLLCGAAALADGADPWSWRCDPFLGGGVTWYSTTQFALTLGLEVGTVPDGWPIIGGHEFGGWIANIGESAKAAGFGGRIATLADVPIWIGVMGWKDENGRPSADAVIFAKKSFGITW